MAYKPTEAQHTICDQVTLCLSRGQILIGEWVAAIPDLTWDKWELWWSDKSFRSWWVEKVPEHHGVTAADHKMVESRAMRALAHGLIESGRDRASLIAAWQRISAAQAAAQDHGLGPADDEEWREYMSGNPEASWIRHGATAEA